MKDIPDLDEISGLDYDFDNIINDTEKIPFVWMRNFLFSRLNLEKQNSENKQIKISPLPHFLKFKDLISFNKSSIEDFTLLDEILKLNSFNTLTGYFLPEFIVDLVDSECIIKIVSAKIAIVAIDDLSLWVRFANKYEKNSTPWREIAIVTLERVSKYDIDTKNIYSVLHSTGIRSWTGIPGTVPQFYYDDVETAKKNLDEEKNDYLIKYWEWDLKVAEESLKQEKGRLEEEDI